MFENLETRRLLAAHIVTPGAGGELVVDGTAGADTISLSVNLLTTPATLVVDLNGTVTNWDLDVPWAGGEWHKLTINGADGNDTITLANEVQSAPGAQGVSITGGNGDDSITSGRGADTILGQAGNDTIIGGGAGDGGDNIDS